MSIILNRPLVFFDVETTGVDVAIDRIIQFSGSRIPAGPFDVGLLMDGGYETLNVYINPGIDIHPEATAVHGVTNEALLGCPKFGEVADRIFEFMQGADLGGFNIRKFDIPILVEEFLREGKNFDARTMNIVDVMEIYHKMNPRNLAAAYREYVGSEMEEGSAHNALNDVVATQRIFLGQMHRYLDFKYSIEEACAFVKPAEEWADYAQKIYIRDGEYYYGIGKAKDKRVKDDPGFGQWMLGQNFTRDTKRIIKQILKL